MNDQVKKETLCSLGLRIVEMRKLMKINQILLAFEANIGLRTLRRIEKGEDNPQALTIISIAIALRVHPSELLKFKLKIKDSLNQNDVIGFCYQTDEHCLFELNREEE